MLKPVGMQQYWNKFFWFWVWSSFWGAKWILRGPRYVCTSVYLFTFWWREEGSPQSPGNGPSSETHRWLVSKVLETPLFVNLTMLAEVKLYSNPDDVWSPYAFGGGYWLGNPPKRTGEFRFRLHHTKIGQTDVSEHVWVCVYMLRGL